MTDKGPDFVGIGAAKAGTSWLAFLMNQHSSLRMASEKEITFFSSEKKWSKGKEWYRSRLPRREPNTLIGEFSVSYMTHAEKTATRLKSMNEQVRLIAILRHPLKRAQSHWNWLHQLGRVKYGTPFNLETTPAVLRDSLYFQNLKPFIEQFGRSQIHVLKYENLVKDPLDTVNRLFTFLEVEQLTKIEFSDQRVGETIIPRWQTLDSFRRCLHRWAGKKGLVSLIELLRKMGVPRLYRLLNCSGRFDRVRPLSFEQIRIPIAHDLIQLEKVIDFSISDWLDDCRLP
ncbi:MAG: sulfotransferase family protein [Nitrospirales bacterium]